MKILVYIKSNKMKSTFFIFIALLTVSVFACKSDTNTQENTKETIGTKATTGKNCKFSIKSNDVKVNWTAFKTTARVGVKGSFDKVEINTANGTPSLSTLMMATSFKVNTATVNSNNPDRDKKLVDFFFAKMTSDLAVTGNVKSVTGSNEQGQGIMAINMNGVSWDTAFKYTVTDNILTLTTSINTDNWNAQDAITSINNACEDLHKGKDGISKTWPDVEISVIVPMDISCD